MSDFISYIENFNNSCFDHDKREVFIASHQNIISDLYKLLTDDLLLQYKQLKNRLLLQTVKDYQKKFKISDCEIEFFYSDIIEELKEGNKIRKPNIKLITNSVNLNKTLNRIIDNYFVCSDLTEIIDNEEYIINYYNIYYIFDNDKINKISDYSDYRFNKHIEFIKRRSFIKILLKDYEFKFREIQ